MEKRLGRKGYEKNVAGNRDRRIDYETLAACIVEGAWWNDRRSFVVRNAIKCGEV